MPISGWRSNNTNRKARAGNFSVHHGGMNSPWISYDQLRSDVAAALQFDNPTDLGQRWSTIITAANCAAQTDLTQMLLGMGYTIGQVNSWDDRVEAVRRLGLLYALQRGNPLGTLNADMVKNLDPRSSIRESGGISIGGAPTSPTLEASQIGAIGSGSLAIAGGQLVSLPAFEYPCWW